MAEFELQTKTSGWLRTLLFGKKNVFHSKKRVLCNRCINNRKDQTVQTYVKDEGNDEKTSSGNSYCDTKSLQRYEECGGKTFSVQQIGNGGLRIYFCIGNPAKTNLSRANKIKMEKNEKLTDSFLELDNRSIFHGSETKISLISNKSHQSLALLNNENKSNSNVDLRAREMTFTETNPLDDAQKYENVASKPIKSETSELICDSHRNLGDNMSDQEESTLQLSKSQSEPVLEPPSPKQPSPTHLPSYKNYAERQLYLTEIDDNGGSNSRKKQNYSITKEDNIVNEYNICQQNKLKRKSLMKSTSGLSRNSLTGIRKKRESYVVNMIPEIISKLDNIEEKLNELEKVQEDKRENLIKTKRISHNHAKRAFLPDLVDLDQTFSIKDCSREEFNKKTHLKPLKVKSHNVHPVFIKSCGEEVYINAPKSVCVVKKIRSKQLSPNCCDKQLVYHNTQELDAHNITSTSVSKISSSKNINSKPANQLTKKPKSDIWRKISEELKF